MTQIVKRTTTKEATQSNLDQDSNYGMTYLNRHFYNMSSMMLPLMVTDVKCSEWFLQYVNMTWMIQIEVIRERRRANLVDAQNQNQSCHILSTLYWYCMSFQFIVFQVITTALGTIDLIELRNINGKGGGWFLLNYFLLNNSSSSWKPLDHNCLPLLHNCVARPEMSSFIVMLVGIIIYVYCNC